MIIKCKLKLILKPGKATPTPPIAPILGQYGINLMEFCNKFNKLTKDIFFDYIYIKIILFNDLKYEILIGTQCLTDLIKKTINIDKFSKKPGKEHLDYKNFNLINIITNSRLLYEKKKINSVRKMILGTLISIGINYE